MHQGMTEGQELGGLATSARIIREGPSEEVNFGLVLEW